MHCEDKNFQILSGPLILNTSNDRLRLNSKLLIINNSIIAVLIAKSSTFNNLVRKVLDQNLNQLRIQTFDSSSEPSDRGEIDMCLLKSGKFVVTFQKFRQNEYNVFSVFFIIFTESDFLDHPPKKVQVNPESIDKDEKFPKVVCLENGNFLLTWVREESNSRKIFAKLFRPDEQI